VRAVQYVEQHMHLIYFWELDAIDLLIPTTERLATYHHEHHVKHNKRFGVYGYVPDWVSPAFWSMFGNGKKVHAATGAVADTDKAAVADSETDKAAGHAAKDS
jgi:hypothetical protein